jgi:hypothetical protein
MNGPKKPKGPRVAPVPEATANLGMLDGRPIAIWLDDVKTEPNATIVANIRTWWDLAKEGTKPK